MQTNAPRTATRILATFANAEEGTAAVVAQITGGYSVTLLDTDAGEDVGIVVVYPTEAQALAAARKIAGVEA